MEAGVLSAVLLAVVEPPQAAREPAIRTAMAALIMRLFFILIFFLQSLGRFLVCPFVVFIIHIFHNLRMDASDLFLEQI